jgi:hypothetical protein
MQTMRQPRTDRVAQHRRPIGTIELELGVSGFPVTDLSAVIAFVRRRYYITCLHPVESACAKRDRTFVGRPGLGGGGAIDVFFKRKLKILSDELRRR